jgi:hypothetical protein
MIFSENRLHFSGSCASSRPPLFLQGIYRDCPHFRAAQALCFYREFTGVTPRIPLLFLQGIYRDGGLACTPALRHKTSNGEIAHDHT